MKNMKIFNKIIFRVIFLGTIWNFVLFEEDNLLKF